MADLKIRSEKIPGIENGSYVFVEGKIGTAGAPVFASHLESTVKSGTTTMLLDFTGVTYINSTALASLLRLEDQLENGYLGLVGIQSNVRVVMNSMGIMGLFNVHETREEAVAAAHEELGDGVPKDPKPPK